IADNNTRFGTSIPPIDSIHLGATFETKILRTESDKRSWLDAHSPSESEWDNEQVHDLALVKHFDRICRRFVSQIYVRDNPRDKGSFLLRGELWDEIKTILAKFNRLKTETRSVAPPRDLFYSIV